MKRLAILLLALGSALVLTLAGCGGGGGGGVGGVANPAFTAVDNLVAPTGTIPAFSGAAAVDDGAGTVADPTVVVGAADDNGATLRAVAWEVSSNGVTRTNTATPLGPASAYSRANGINNSGAIVGEMGSPIVPVLWPNRLSAATNLPLAGAVSGAAYAVSSDNVIVGETTVLDNANAVVWTIDNGVISAPTVLSTAPSSAAYAVNSTPTLKEYVGEMTNATGTHAVVWRDNTTAVTEIVLPGDNVLAGESIAMSINSVGTIIGEIMDTGGFIHAVRWVKGTGTTYTVQDMGIGSANSINAGGRVVGTTDLGAAAWGAGGATSILMNAALSGGQANDISDTGRAVGVNGLGKAFIALP